ncbi:MAG: basic amino acid ABC transporter substrate-binding protein [Spirochaetaceae bacterium]|nr:basic amino acid ABC transporter substrate-binding protein [Spirochaetaceae bacterium]
MKKNIIALLILLTLTTGVVFAQGSKESTTEGPKTYIMAANCEWPPLEFIDENGKITGFEMELLVELSTVTGYNFQPKNVAWDGIFAGLANGAYDGVASGVSVTEERKKALVFSDPILTVKQSIIVLEDNEVPPTSVNELKEKKVGVQIGTTGDILLQDSGVDITIMSYDSIALAIEDLINGNLDAVVLDSVVAGEYVITNKVFANKLKVSGTSDENLEPIAMCFKKENTELVAIVNKGLKQLQESGKMDELKAKWAIL